MSSSSQTMIESIQRIKDIGLMPASVAAFLQRPAALDFMEDYLHETGTSVDEAVLILLAAIRYIDNKAGYAIDVPTVLEMPDGAINLDLFLVRHHAELYHICRSRRIQSNLPQRAFSILEILYQRFGPDRLAVLELGCAFGLIGRVLCAPSLVLGRFERYFAPGIQRPSALAEVAAYRGFDMEMPDEAWLLACLPFASDRRRLDCFLREVPPGPDFQVSRASALDFPEYTAIMDLEPRFAVHHASRLIPVVLTSFLMYQIPPEKRQGLVSAISTFTSRYGGAWINLDHHLLPDGRYQFGLEMDGRLVWAFNNDSCQTWAAV